MTIDKVLQDAMYSHVMAFLDDFIIYSNSWEEHIKHVTDIFERLHAAGFTVNRDKVQVGCKEVKLLCCIESQNFVRPDPEKLEATRDIPVLKSVKDIQRFLGLCGFYRSYIKIFYIIAKPLSRLLKKYVPLRGESENNVVILS
jgi:hypothetical protein